MARVISFFPKQTFIGGPAGSITVASEVFEVTNENRLDIELRVYGTNPATTTVTGTLETTSDSTFVDAAWKQVASTFTVGPGAGITSTALSGLGQFVRAKMTVSTTGFAYACMNAVARVLD